MPTFLSERRRLLASPIENNVFAPKGHEERASLPLRGKSNICPKGPLRFGFADATTTRALWARRGGNERPLWAYIVKAFSPSSLSGPKGGRGLSSD